MEVQIPNKPESFAFPSRDVKCPTVVVVIGMAGTGKTTFTSRLFKHLVLKSSKKVYGINLDPAVLKVPFPTNIDIRDTVNYKQVMRNYGLGPNGAIMTSLNLFATRIDQVLKLLEKRKNDFDYILVDTPGQIEVFNWSASGNIILETLASCFPTVIAFVTDCHRCQRPNTFISNMLYATGVFYKFKMPFLVVFNKTDAAPKDELMKWMEDPVKFDEASRDDESYASSMARDCAWKLSPFYSVIKTVGLSCVNDVGFDEVEELLSGVLLNEYYEEYVPRLQELRKEIMERRNKQSTAEFVKFKNDFMDSKITDGDEDEEENEEEEIEEETFGLHTEAHCL